MNKRSKDSIAKNKPKDVIVVSENRGEINYQAPPPTQNTSGVEENSRDKSSPKNTTVANNAIVIDHNDSQSNSSCATHHVTEKQGNLKEILALENLQKLSPISRFARKLFGLTNDPLKTICEQSASPKVCQKRNWNPSKVNKRNTNSSGTDQKETHYKLAINGMPPQILTKSSGKRHQHISDIDKSAFSQDHHDKFHMVAQWLSELKSDDIVQWPDDQDLQKPPSYTTTTAKKSEVPLPPVLKESQKEHGMAFAQQNNRIVKISPGKGVGHHHYYQHQAAKDCSANGSGRGVNEYSEPGICKRCMNHSKEADMNPEFMKLYLKSHPEVLEKFLLEEDGMELEQLERLMIRRTQRAKKMSQSMGNKNVGRKASLSRWRFCVHADKRQMLQDLTQSLQLRPTKSHVLWELSSCICSAVGADGFRLFIVDNTNPTDNLTSFLGMEDMNSDGQPQFQKLKRNETAPIAQFVARTREPIRYSRGNRDSRFPDMAITDEHVSHILCQAVAQPDGQLVAVLELFRVDEDMSFYEEDEEIAYSYLVWGGIALHYAHLFLNMNKQKKLNDFLLAVVKSIFQDMVSMDMLVMKVMNFAQRLVDADRASLFLVDSKCKELYATIFDIGSDAKQGTGAEDKTQNATAAPKEIRFPMGTGIAGQVALTGEVLNIKNAYADHRFNRTIDQLTGYKTESILCMPIFIRGSVIGVVQMINKRSGFFTKEDEEAFEMFAVYCGLALHHAKLYDKIRRSEQKYRVALEVLSYHNTCTRTEVDRCLTDPMDPLPHIDSYYFNPFQMDDFEKAQQAIYMFTDLFGLLRFDRSNIIRFTLTVKKNYRRVPYHNWTHGFSVANSMYSIIKHSNNAFRPNECLALYISSLCHDLDHRGKNNKFMCDTESPLAAIYSTSTMEHHHFNQTVTILQQDGHNIFGKLTNNEYKQVLSLIKHCILATDLAVFFPNKSKLSTLIEEEKFSWSIVEHRMLIQAIAMTASDLSAAAKPWEIQEKTVKVIFEEFYQQGDAEREAGRTPIEMMDRYKPHQQASSQVGFLTGICQPCYTLLWRLIPETKPLHDMLLENLRKWQEISDDTKISKEDEDKK